MSHVMCHMSYGMCQVAKVMCHNFFSYFNFLFIFLQSGGASRWRVCYQRGLPRLVFLIIMLCLILLDLTFSTAYRRPLNILNPWILYNFCLCFGCLSHGCLCLCCHHCGCCYMGPIIISIITTLQPKKWFLSNLHTPRGQLSEKIA